MKKNELLVSIHSDDETPGLGSGWRIVLARDTRGGKRVMLSNPHTEGRQSVTVETYNKIVREEYEYE